MNEGMIDFADLVEEEIRGIEAKKPSERTVGEWVFLAEYDLGVLDDRDFPFDRMSPEDWKEIILREPIVLQYDPPVAELLEIMTEKDFGIWDSCEVCLALLFGGVWLAEAGLLPLEKITQADFDANFGKIPFPTAEEFWDVAPGYFPAGFPPHIRLPFPVPDGKEEKRLPDPPGIHLNT